MLLLARCSPQIVLTAAKLGLLAWLLRGKLVVSTAALTADYIDALLRFGAVAVMAPGHNAGATRSQQFGHFFSAFYENLCSGSDALAALTAAESQQPTLRGVFMLSRRGV
jgi:hypothetical protein